MRACAHPVPFTKLSPKEEGHKEAEEELGALAVQEGCRESSRSLLELVMK